MPDDARCAAATDTDDRPHGSCPICRRRDPDYGRICEPCRAWQPLALASIPTKYADVGELLIPAPEPDDRTAVNGRPHFDPIGARLTAGPVAGESANPRVSGSREPPAPLDLDMHDLLGDVVRDGGRDIDVTGDNWVPLMIGTKPRKIWTENGWKRVGRRVMVPAGDQIGVVPIAQVIDQEVRAWADAGAPGARFRPTPVIPAMVEWLSRRLSWAFDHYEPIDVFAAAIRDVRGRLMAALGEFDPPDLPCYGVECKRCSKRMLFRVQNGSGDVECKNPDCLKVYGLQEYAEWAKWVGSYERSKYTPEEVQGILSGRLRVELEAA